jgi:molybdenum cofactor synthesis domain-containing protein
MSGPTPAWSPSSGRLQAKVCTVSDGVVAGVREDRSGAAVAERLELAGYQVLERRVVADGVESVAAVIAELADGFEGLIVTTGGTGFGPRDLTPEGTLQVLDRVAPGLAEAMRLASPLGRLSRATAGTLATSLVVNLPGSTSGSVECLEAILEVLPHALALLRGESPH